METCQAPFIRKRCFRIAILVLSFLHVLKRIHKERKMKMLTTTFNVVKLYIYMYVYQLISIFLKKKIRTIFTLNIFTRFVTKIRKMGREKKEKKTCHNSAISLFPAVQISFFKLNFSPMENGHLRMQNLRSVEIGKKRSIPLFIFPPIL